MKTSDVPSTEKVASNANSVREEAEELLAKALEGDMEAIQRIWELVDGKPE